MPYCSQCGIRLEDPDRFCPACGTPAREPQGAAGSSPPPLPGAHGAGPPAVPGGLVGQGVGIRLVAQIIDSVVILAFYLILGRLVAGTVDGGLTPDGFELQGGPALAVIGLTTAFWIAYFTLLEGLWQGRSLGKKLLGLRVVRQDGAPMDLHTALVRNLLRLVDGQLGYLVGAILVWTSPLKQRLGDRVAHTLVVKKTP
ncbi:MAG: RDD family protein [Pseudomonadota bacterium]